MSKHTIVTKLEVKDESKPEALAQVEMVYTEREVDMEDVLTFEGALIQSLAARLGSQQDDTTAPVRKYSGRTIVGFLCISQRGRSGVVV